MSTVIVISPVVERTAGDGAVLPFWDAKQQRTFVIFEIPDDEKAAVLAYGVDLKGGRLTFRAEISRDQQNDLLEMVRRSGGKQPPNIVEVRATTSVRTPGEITAIVLPDTGPNMGPDGGRMFRVSVSP